MHLKHGNASSNTQRDFIRGVLGCPSRSGRW
jgi:hypothetical protein